MNPFRSSQAAAPNWRAAVDACAAQLGSSSADASLGFVFCTDALAPDMGEIVEALRRRTGVAQWLGTVGIGICGGSDEHYDRPAISALVADLPPGAFRVFGTLRDDLGPFRQAHAGWIDGSGSRFAIVHGDPRNPRLPELLAGLAGELHDGFVVGGLTSSRGDYAQVAGTVTQGGLSGAMFASDVAVATTLTQGCAPFGEVHEITRCERNVLVELDGRPALEVFFAEVGDVLSRDLERAANFVGVALPVAGSDRRDYLVRNLVGADRERKLLAIGELVEEGRQIRFCWRDPASAERDMRTMLGELKGRLPGRPRGGLYYSCLGRGRNLFGDESREIAIIRDELGDFPLAGCYCNGEISHNRLYGYTGVLAVFP